MMKGGEAERSKNNFMVQDCSTNNFMVQDCSTQGFFLKWWWHVELDAKILKYKMKMKTSLGVLFY